MTWIGIKLLKSFCRPERKAKEIAGSVLIQVIRKIEQKKARSTANASGQRGERKCTS